MMKITKKILLIACLSAMALSCSQKQPAEIVHNEEAAKIVNGSWQLSTMSQAKFSPDPEDPEFVLGVLTYKSKTTQKFLENRTFETTVSQEGLSFDFTKEEYADYGYTKDELVESLKNSITFYGTYTISENQLILENNEVSFNGEDKLSFDQAITSFPNIGQKKQVMDWELKDNKLVFYQNINGKELSVSYTKTDF